MKEEKYTIVKNGVDDYSLKYGDKEIKLRSYVGLAEKIQNVYSEARRKMIMDLSADGRSLNSLITETKKDGKTLVDTSNADALENLYIEREYEKVFEECVKDITGMTFTELCVELKLETDEEGIKLGEDIGLILSGNFPSW